MAYTWLRKELRGLPVDVLVIDGDHSAKGVLQDFDTYSPLVRPGGMVLMHDIAVMNDPRAQVCLVWPELSTRYVHEEIRSTQHRPYGWGIIHIPPMKVGGAV
jgi:cephalosporin hydroxylase